jgi:histidyl-tRNA synthetase
VLDCKKEGCQAATAKAPLLVDRLCEECKTHWGEVRRALDLLKVEIEVNPRIVRGLDYYVRTSFELVYRGAGLGSQNAIGGGGRYDGLVKQLGGPDTPGVGFALGMERMFLALQAQKGVPGKGPMVFLAPMGPAAGDRAMALARELRAQGLRVEMDYEAKPKGLSNVLDKANRRGATVAVLLGEAELAKGIGTFKTLATGEQVERSLDASLAGWLKQKVGDR